MGDENSKKIFGSSVKINSVTGECEFINGEGDEERQFIEAKREKGIDTLVVWLWYGGYNLQYKDSDKKKIYEGKKQEKAKRGYVAELQKDLARACCYGTANRITGEFDNDTLGGVLDLKAYLVNKGIVAGEEIGYNSNSIPKFVRNKDGTHNGDERLNKMVEAGTVNKKTREYLKEWVRKGTVKGKRVPRIPTKKEIEDADITRAELEKFIDDQVVKEFGGNFPGIIFKAIKNKESGRSPFTKVGDIYLLDYGLDWNGPVRFVRDFNIRCSKIVNGYWAKSRGYGPGQATEFKGGWPQVDNEGNIKEDHITSLKGNILWCMRLFQKKFDNSYRDKDCNSTPKYDCENCLKNFETSYFWRSGIYSRKRRKEHRIYYLENPDLIDTYLELYDDPYEELKAELEEKYKKRYKREELTKKQRKRMERELDKKYSKTLDEREENGWRDASEEEKPCSWATRALRDYNGRSDRAFDYMLDVIDSIQTGSWKK